jgi:two-component system CitB family sensor kinase/two-component system sensor histidine kinase DcuS
MGFLRSVFGAMLPRSLQAQMIVLLGLLVLVQIGISGIIFGSLVADILEDQIGKRALDIAQTVARDPLVARSVTLGDPEGKVQSLVDPIRLATGAEYIVVCDRQGLRLSHPDSWKIGQRFVGGDEGPALEEGRSYVSSAVGTLGPSLRGFAPVFGDEGRVTGFVAVGYLLEDVHRTILQHQLQPRVFVFMMGLVGLLGAVLIAGRFKRAILGLEPREIASLYQERGAILETIREGVLAVDRHGEVRLANAAARRDLGLAQEGEEDLVGQPASHLIPQAPVAEVLEKGQAVLDREMVRNGVAFLVSVIPVIHQEQVMGVVASFRRKDELDRLTSELSQVREYSELLRAQSHEHSNQLHTVAGLIQIGAPQEALDLILNETRDYQDLISLLNAAVPHPLVSGLIIGKCHRASELKVQFVIDPESSLCDIPASVNQERLVTILGNLVDNALEAALVSGREPKMVRLSMTDLGHDLIIEVEDTGPGVPVDQVEHIFQRGVTAKKGANHGVGLHLVRENLESLNGQVTVGESELGGAMFTISIPKEGGVPS